MYLLLAVVHNIVIPGYKDITLHIFFLVLSGICMDRTLLVLKHISDKMQANPEKFQAIIPGKIGHENCTSLTVCGSEIKCEVSVKLLGVTIDFMLNLDEHVSNICRKAARQINVLLRIGKHLSVETKILIYKSFIKSNFNYCPLVWHFCSKSSTAKMEKLQYRAL